MEVDADPPPAPPPESTAAAEQLPGLADSCKAPTVPAAPPARSQEEVDAERGFTDDDLNACLKVLHAFRAKLDLLQQKEYRPLRSAGIIFVEGISKRYFKGLSPEEYNHNKARKIARKERRKHEALEDQKRLAKTKMREDKLRRMERLMEGAASPPQLMLKGSAAAGAIGADVQTALALPPVDPLSLGVVTIPAERVATRYNSERINLKRKRKNQQQQQQQGAVEQQANKSNDASKGKSKGKNKKGTLGAQTTKQTAERKSATAAKPAEPPSPPSREEVQKRAKNEARGTENEERRKEIESDRMDDESHHATANAEAKEEEEHRGPKTKGEASLSDEDEESVLHQPEECYICKATYHKLHHFYDRLCPACAQLNWNKRVATADLKGYIALVTGGRVKIGFETAVILLRAGATVIVTTRFPHDAALRFSKLADFGEWHSRLHVYGLDMRYLQAVEQFCRFVKKAYSHLDIIINNAAQTIRRPPAYYEHLITAESVNVASLPEPIRHVLQPEGLPVKPWGNDYLLPLFSSSSSSTTGLFELTTGPSPALAPPAQPPVAPVVEEPVDDQEAAAGLVAEEKHAQAAEAKGNEMEAAGGRPVTTDQPPNPASALPNISAVLTQLAVAKGDEKKDPKLFPPGRYDEHGQQVDLRHANSWVLQLDQVSTVELAEVHVINALAPYTINSLLRPLLNLSPNADKFIVNVSSVEGEFYHKKTTAHPHTNMAKASLNMMTRTAAAYYARDRIWMNAVDTGWISDMNPVYRSQRIANKYGQVFRNPIDEVDGAARILDPVFARLNEGKLYFGKFLKDYRPSAW